jgi:outer membrane protein assembly factor BamB
MQLDCRSLVFSLSIIIAVASTPDRAPAQAKPADSDQITVGNDAQQALQAYAQKPAGVSLPDSPGAVDLLKKAQLEAGQKHWDSAADLFQKAIAQFPARVVQIHDNDPKPEQGTSHYCGIAQVVQERLATWPDDGLKTYTGLFEQTAAGLLNAAPPHDAGPLLPIFWTYFTTDSGKTAGIRLMDCYLEAGNFQAAQWTGTQLLSFHPNLGDDRAMVVYRTALASHYLGDDKTAQQLLGSLQQNSPAPTGTIAGKDVQLTDSLAATLATPRAAAETNQTVDADTYPRFGGAGGCGEISSSTVKLGGVATHVPFNPPRYQGFSPNQLKQLLAADQSGADQLVSASIPVVDNGAVFVQDGRSIYALDLPTGAPLPGWLRTYSGEHRGAYTLDIPGRARNELLTVTVSPAVVTAVLGQADPLAIAAVHLGKSLPPLPSPARLVCLDRQTGRELWTAAPKDLPEVEGTLNRAEYDGSPLIIPAPFSARGKSAAVEDSIVITARTGRQNQFDECYLVCLSLKSGQYLWSTYLGGSTHGFRIKGDPSQMAFADGRIFVTTNLGVVAAIDPSDGRIIWLNSYAHASQENSRTGLLDLGRSRDQAAGLSPSASWEHNPVVVTGSTVFTLPNDSQTLFVYNASNGSEIGHLPMNNWDNAKLLLGVRDGELLINSNTKVFGIDWQKYASAGDPADATHWSADISFIDKSTICGRGFVTAKSIFMPTTNRLVAIDRGRIRAVYPKHGTLDITHKPRALLATASAIVVTGDAAIDLYSNPPPPK